MKYSWIALLLVCKPIWAIEHTVKGILDIRAFHVSSDAKNDSYLTGDYGKFQYNQGSGIALGQLGLQYQMALDNGFSFRLVANGYSDDIKTKAGLTEGFLSYKGLPSQNGWRQHAKLGVFYPKISLENIATAWSTPYTLTSSTLNNWIGEELRHTGLSYGIEKLGKFHQSPHNFGIDLSVFQRNDTAGAMIPWHGWTLGSRQTLLNETLVIQHFPARQYKLAAQAPESDPFLELDNRFGVHIRGHWQYQNNLKLDAGFYDNNAKKGIVESGQYTWTTQFYHLGLKYSIDKSRQLIAQYLKGTTLMTSPYLEDVVKSKYDNGFIMLRQRMKSHHLALRLEYFSVDDLDGTIGDNNDEDGKAITINYRYQLERNQFIMLEHNWIDSTRKSRAYQQQPIELTERQWQVAYRYYF